MREGTDQTGEAAIRAATEYILTSLNAKNERVDAKVRRQVERDVAGTFAWMVTSYRGEGPMYEAVAKGVIAGVLQTQAHMARLLEPEVPE